MFPSAHTLPLHTSPNLSIRSESSPPPPAPLHKRTLHYRLATLIIINSPPAPFLCTTLPSEFPSYPLAKMKLLGWMHRKFRQNSSGVSKDFPGGGTCSCLSGHPLLEDDHNQRQLNLFTARSLGLPPDDHYRVRAGGGNQAMDEFWGGLLAIGTMGMGPDPIQEEDAAVVSDVGNEKEKPAKKVKDETEIAIPVGVEAIGGKVLAEATAVTDLTMVTAELEKVLAAETKLTAISAPANIRFSSARPSQVGSGPGPALCPLQDFLFGSAIELAETARRPERRPSLGELFMRSHLAEDDTGGGKEESSAKLAGESLDFAVGDGKPEAAGKHMMKRILRRRGSKGSGGGGASVEASAKETMFHKILQIFHRKVHPEKSSVIKSRRKTRKNENKGAYVPDVAVHGHTSIRNDALSPANLNGAYRKEIIPNFSFCSSNSPYFASISSDSRGHREHWIKTDADYLVLEL